MAQALCIKGFDQLDKAALLARGPRVITIGNFDGVHRGHQQLLGLAVTRAQALGGVSVAVTFRPHPRAVLDPKAPLDLLLTYDEKLEVIQSLGVDVVIEEPFSRDFSSRSPQDFIRSSLIYGLGASEIIVGHDFRFGRGREGSLDSLKQECEQSGVRLLIMDPYEWKGVRVSSTGIRANLRSGKEGAIGQAAELLGRPYFYRGIVRRGDGRGHKIGFPTANLEVAEKLVLPSGVYVTQAVIRSSGEAFASVTNVGVRPTFQAKTSENAQKSGGQRPAEIRVECHILDFDRDLYGSELEVRFLHYLRAEKKFNGVEELVRQITQDIQHAREINARQA